jgi:UDP-2,3-diacylglucosamine pyrophosphatase LpxH
MNLEHYRRQIYEGLEREYVKPSYTLSAELDSLKLIAFSDLHRGARDGADDFQCCERAFNAALAYYFRAGYTLCLLGDIEELWECQAGTVVSKYQHSYELERKFREEGRYIRISGNHDDLWEDPKAVKRYLGPVGLDGPVWRSLRLEVLDGGARLGEIFFLHGHQGTNDSDKWSGLSRLFIRYVWRNIQRLTHKASTTPAKDWVLRQNHDTAMYRWALSKRDNGLMLFSGHTHRPVFASESLVDQLTRRLKEQRTDDPQYLEKRRALEAELEWVRASEFQTPKAIEMEAPCYFNTGCCSYEDGDVTGLEIANGQVNLVRLPNDAERPIPQVLNKAPADLRLCFEAIRGERRVRAPGVTELVPTPGMSSEGEVPPAPH